MKSLYTTTLTGTKMGQLGKIPEGSIQVGSELSIHRRPDNAYDSQAMSVHFGSGITSPQIGWIPAKEIEDKATKGILFNLVGHGIPLRAIVEQFDHKTRFVRVNVILDESLAITDRVYSGDEDE